MSFFDGILRQAPTAEDSEGPPGVRTPGGFLRVGLVVKVTGGKLNGLVGKIVKIDLTPGGSAAVYFYLEESKTEFEGVVEQHFLEDFAQWKAKRTATELQLKGV